MSWFVPPLTGSLNGVTFDVEAIDDELARALVRHAYPDRDGADLEDMGAEARVVSLDGTITGTDWLARVRELEDAFAAAGDHTLTHPQFGTLIGRAERLNTRHQESQHNRADIRLTFVAGAPEAAAFGTTPSTSSAAVSVRMAATDTLTALSALEG